MSLAEDIDRKIAISRAKQKASFRAAMSAVWAAGGTTQIFDFHSYPENKEPVSKYVREAYGIALQQELAKIPEDIIG